MNTFKKLGAGLLGVIAAMTSLTACQDYDAPRIDAPVATEQANISIYDLKEEFWSDETNYIWGTEQKADATPVAIPAREDGSHYIIKGTVVSSDEAGNVFKSLIIQDETAALAISINSYNLYLKYRVGQEVVIDVTGMYIGKYNGLLQLGAPEWYANGNAWEASFMAPETFQAHVELNGWPDVAAIDTTEVKSFTELGTSPDQLMYWQSRLVKLNNVSFVNGGVETYSEYHSSGVNQSITDSEGNSLIVRTSGYSNFWNQTLPVGNFDLVCIASYYGTTGWQLMMIDAEGVTNLGNPTESPGTESNPYTVNEAITEVAAGRTPNGWVTGYIVGTVAPEVTSVTSNSDIEWTSTPILGNTLVIGQTADTKDIANAMVIELPAGSALYNYGNLVDHPENYGKQIWVRGTMSTYMDTYGIVGNNGAAGTWKIDGVEAGGPAKPGDGTKDSPYNTQQVIAMNPQSTTDAVESGVWISGYIVGYMPSTNTYLSNTVFGTSEAVATNLVVGPTADCTDPTQCVAIQLPTGSVRSALNLQANPGNIGAQVSLYGDIMKYCGGPGLKNTSDYVLGTGTGGGGNDNPTPPGPSNGDGTEANPYTCADVMAMNPQSSDPVKSGVWTKGYIVGWANMASVYYINDETATFSVPASMATNILLADSPTATSYTQCIGVQLPSGAVRNALNLMNNPGNLGKEVLIKGDIAKYSGVAGIRSASDYKLDGGGTTPPDNPGGSSTVVTSLNENFANGSIPAGWTQKQIAGDKEWYVTSFSGTYYASMTGYKGNPPFDSWLVTPGLDLSKMSDKVLTFRTEFAPYGSTTSKFEVYVLNGADPATATRTQLNPALPTSASSTYSDWVESGNLDLSAFSGTVYIGFRYYATADDNYATWCLTDVKVNAGGTPGGDNPTPPAGDVYTVAQALSAINSGNPPSAPVKVQGVISAITEVSTQYGNATYIIKDNANDANGLEIYRGYYLDGAKFTAENQLEIGATVVVEGTLVLYGGNKPEMTQSKIVSYTSAGGSTPSQPENPSTPSGDYKGDFNSFNGGTAKSSYATYTNATGWKAENAAILSGSSNASANNPYFPFIGGDGILAVCLNGNTEKVGVLTSPLLSGSIGTLTFNYGFPFNDSKCSFTINVKDSTGKVVKTDTVDLASLEQKHAYSYSLAVNYSGNFTIEIVNNCKSEKAQNSDRVAIWNLTWTD